METFTPEIAAYFPVVIDTFIIFLILWLSWTCLSMKKY
jgi:hypothetical protein